MNCTELASTPPIASISNAGLRTSANCVYIITVPVVINVVLLLALLFSLLRNCRAHRYSNTRPASYDCYDNEHLRDVAESDTGETRRPPQPPPPPPLPSPIPPNHTNPPSFGTRPAIYSEASEYVEGGDKSVRGVAEPLARFLSNSSNNELLNNLGKSLLKSCST